MDCAKDGFRNYRHCVLAGAVLLLLCVLQTPLEAHDNKLLHEKLTLNLNEIELSEVMQMLADRARANILLAKGVSGEVSINLYDVSVEDAIHSIAAAAGYVVEIRNKSYFILKQEDAGKHIASELTQLRTFKVQYSDPKVVEDIVKPYLSNYGKITALEERKLLVVQDTPQTMKRIERLLVDADRSPRQILIEAKILEITLDSSETFGIDWRKLFTADDGSGAFGLRGFSSSDSQGFFMDYVNPNVEVLLDALETRGRVRTLSTPKILALEDREASVVIGDRIGYRVTTTINQITTENVEFLESGVILNVKPTIDRQGNVMLDVHPEVSTGTIASGLPNQTTTEVTTQLLVKDGQTVFIGGLIKLNSSRSERSFAGLGSVPLLGKLFSREEKVSVNTETVVLITPYILTNRQDWWSQSAIKKINKVENTLDSNAAGIDAAHTQAADTSDNIESSAETDTDWRVHDERVW